MKKSDKEQIEKITMSLVHYIKEIAIQVNSSEFRHIERVWQEKVNELATSFAIWDKLPE